MEASVLKSKRSVAAISTVTDATGPVHAQEGNVKPVFPSIERFDIAKDAWEHDGSDSKAASRVRYPQLDTLLTRDALIQKWLFASVTGDGTPKNSPHLCKRLMSTQTLNTRLSSSSCIGGLRGHTSTCIASGRGMSAYVDTFSVLHALVERFEKVAEHASTDPLLCRAVQMKLCAGLVGWLEHYPGDFIGSATQFVLSRFIESVTQLSWLAQYTSEIREHLRQFSRWQDLESAWALPDHKSDPGEPIHATYPESVMPDRRPSLVPSLTSTYSTASPAPSVTTPNYEQQSTPFTPTLSSDADMASHQSDLKSGLLLSTRGRSYSDAGTNASSEVSQGAVSAPYLASRESTRRHASLIEASNLVIDTPVDKLALQIMRLSWDIFARMTVSFTKIDCEAGADGTSAA